MKNNISTNVKQLRADVKKYGLSSISKAKGAIEDSVLCGIALLKLKEITPHGQWENVFKSAIDGVFGVRHGQKLMQIAAKKDLLLTASKDEVLTINDAIEFVSNATPEQIAKAEQLKLEKEAQARQVEAERQRRAEEKRKQEEKRSLESKKDTDIIEGEFQSNGLNSRSQNQTKNTDVIEINKSEFEELNDRFTETLSVNDALSKELESIAKVFDSNDQLSEAHKEIKRLTDLNAGLENRLNSHLRTWQNERKELIGSLNHWKRRAEKAEKLLEKVNAA